MTTYPLSETEYAIYSGSDRNVSTAYDLPVKIILEPNTDMERLENAIHKVVKLNPALNTSFGTDENGETYKYHRTNNSEIYLIETDEIDLYSLIKPFDLENDSLYRFYLIKTKSEKMLFFYVHHIISDLAPNTVLLSQIHSIYSGEDIEKNISEEDFSLEGDVYVSYARELLYKK